VANFTVATNENFKDSSGTVQERTEWHRIVVWGKLAEICSQYLKKGRQVYIEGRLQTRSWDDTKSGEKKYTTEIVCSDMQMLGGQREQAGGNAAYEGSASTSERPQMNAHYPEQTQGDSMQARNPSTAMLEHEKDDLPF